MDFALSPKAAETREQMWDFMRSHVMVAIGQRDAAVAETEKRAGEA